MRPQIFISVLSVTVSGTETATGWQIVRDARLRAARSMDAAVPVQTRAR